MCRRIITGIAALVCLGAPAGAQTITRSQNGQANIAIISQDTDDNDVRLTQKGRSNLAHGLQTGLGNTLGILQRGGGNEAVVVQQGTTNNSVVDQGKARLPGTTTGPTYETQIVQGKGGASYVSSYVNNGFDLLTITGAGSTSFGSFGRSH